MFEERAIIGRVPHMKLVMNKLFEIFIYLGKKECIIEQERQKLCENELFESRQVFEAIAQGNSQFFNHQDLCKFLVRYLPREKAQYVNSNSAHYVMRYWEQNGPQGKQVGNMNLTDFNCCVLTVEVPLLRAKVTQRPTLSGGDVPRSVLRQVAELLLLEHDIMGNFEHMKVDLENIKGYSTVETFNMLDNQKMNYLTSGSLWDFMYAMAGPKRNFQPTKRRLNSLLRRVALKTEQKISFYDFAQILKPTQLKAYIERSLKYKNSKLQYVEELEAEKNKLFTDIQINKKVLGKPLQAVNRSQVLLNKRMVRNVNLLSPQANSFMVYKSNNEFERQLQQQQKSPYHIQDYMDNRGPQDELFSVHSGIEDYANISHMNQTRRTENKTQKYLPKELMPKFKKARNQSARLKVRVKSHTNTTVSAQYNDPFASSNKKHEPSLKGPSALSSASMMKTSQFNHQVHSHNDQLDQTINAMSPVVPSQKASVCVRCCENTIENLNDNCDVLLNSTYNMEQRQTAVSAQKTVDANQIHFTFKSPQQEGQEAHKSYGHIPMELTAQPLNL